MPSYTIKLSLIQMMQLCMQTSLLVVPQAFIECEVRVYDKRELKDRVKDDQKEKLR